MIDRGCLRLNVSRCSSGRLDVPAHSGKSIDDLTPTVAIGRMCKFGRIKIYAIIETGGKQYKVAPGQVVDVDHLDVAEGNSVALDKVLFIDSGDKVTVGTPTVEGAKVIATSQGEGKGKKVIVFRYKPKVRYRKKTGHRRWYTRLAIDEIVEPEVGEGKSAKPVRRRKKEVSEDGA